MSQSQVPSSEKIIRSVHYAAAQWLTSLFWLEAFGAICSRPLCRQTCLFVPYRSINAKRDVDGPIRAPLVSKKIKISGWIKIKKRIMIMINIEIMKR
jgi:hypothetical protein